MNEPIGTKNNNYKTYKILITILILLVFCCLGYMYKMTSRSKSVIVELKSDKLVLINELEKAKLNLIVEALKNKTLSAQLMREKRKIENIIKQLNKPGVTTVDIAKYKNYVTKLNFKVDSLSKKVIKYKISIDSSSNVISENEVEKKLLIQEKSDLQSKIETVSNNLYFYNLSAASFKKKESGKVISTQKASRVNNITVKFEIAENKLAKKQEKVFYFQIIDPKFNVIGQKASISFGKKELVYSDTINLEYDLKTVQLEKTIEVENLEKGNYTVNIFDKNKLILNTSFILE